MKPGRNLRNGPVASCFTDEETGSQKDKGCSLGPFSGTPSRALPVTPLLCNPLGLCHVWFFFFKAAQNGEGPLPKPYQEDVVPLRLS